MLNQCKRLEIEIRDFEGVIEINLGGKKKTVKTDNSEYEAESVIIASGSRHKPIGIPGEKEFKGKGVNYCAVCDGFFFKGKEVLVVGGNSAAISALYLDNLASEVYLVHRKDRLRKPT